MWWIVIAILILDLFVFAYLISLLIRNTLWWQFRKMPPPPTREEQLAWFFSLPEVKVTRDGVELTPEEAVKVLTEPEDESTVKS